LPIPINGGGPPQIDPFGQAQVLMQLMLGANGGVSAPELSPPPAPPPLDPYSSQSPTPIDVSPEAIPEQWIPCSDPNLSRPPSPAHKEQAEKHVMSWMKHSADFMEDKIPLLDLLEDLYYGRRKLNEWNEQFIHGALLSMNRAGRRRARGKDWRSQFVISCAPFCDNYTQSMHSRIFASKDFYIVDVRPKSGPSIEDPDFPTGRKIQRKLIDSCNELQFQSRTHEVVSDEVIFGTQVSKTIWDEKIVMDWEVNIADPNPRTRYRQTPRCIRQGTKVKVVNLAKFLPDPVATNGDIQDWSGIGDRTIVSYDLLANRFGKNGPYNLNKEKFFEQWDEHGDKLNPEDAEEIKDDKSGYDQEEMMEATFLRVWEWHGEIHFSDRPEPTECVCTVITGLRAKDPRTGVLVRLREAPALRLGKRPYLVTHFVPVAGPLGLGLIEMNLDIIWYLSHCVNLFIDVVRFTSIPVIKALSSAAFLANRDDEGAIVWTPGMVLECTSNLNEIGELTLQVPQLASLIELIQYLEAMLQKRTAVSDATRGVSETRKTATESHILQVQSQQPIAEKLNLFAETFLNPYAEIALSNFAQYVREDQQIWVLGKNGQPEPRILTVAEISAGQYSVRASLDIEDSAKISKAQTAIQFVPVLQNLEMPLLINESIKLTLKPIIDSICSNLDIADPDLIMQLVDEQTQQQLIQQKQPPPQPPPPPVPSESIPFKDVPIAGKIGMLRQVGIETTPFDYMGMGLGLDSSMESGMSGQGGQPTGQPEQGMFPFSGMMAPGANGGPVGPQQNGLNEMFGRMQQNAQVASPVQPGMTGPA
jgi:hypothetical protein